ncbi:Efflux pump radE [Fusarium oxysporum f. sp. cubense]|uniref:Efflux pump radE n=1 Tax=Fusarium oxysporum f. sp. cubense TaxID=61366 RepID=A0A559LLT1_FUSOC|nr:Efflux pump radE [Fusarium oxysporum f. sp. cubense]
MRRVLRKKTSLSLKTRMPLETELHRCSLRHDPPNTSRSSMFAPGVPDIMREFETSNRNIATFVVSVYVLGFAFGLLLAAPLSEIYGRAIVFNIANVLFLLIAIFTGFIATLCYFAAPETYAPTLLRTKAAKLKKETGNSDLYSILDKDGLTPKQRFSNDSIRPMRMLFTHLPVFILSLSTSPSSTACCTSCSAPSPLYLRSSMGLVLAPSVWRISLQVLECCLVVIKKKVEQNGKKEPEDRLPIWMTLPSGLLIVGGVAFVWLGGGSKYALDCAHDWRCAVLL